MFASASHEFRTPLNAILNSFKFVESSFDSVIQKTKAVLSTSYSSEISKEVENMKKFIRMGSSSSMLLLSLIEDILDLSKMDSGTFKMTFHYFSPLAAINEVYEIFNFQCKLKKIDLNLDITETVKSTRILSDKGRIKQVLLNLLSNAFKFTFQGSITIK